MFQIKYIFVIFTFNDAIILIFALIKFLAI